MEGGKLVVLIFTKNVLGLIFAQILERMILLMLVAVLGIRKMTMEMGFSMPLMLVLARQRRMVLLMDVRVGNGIRMMMGLQMQLMNVLKLHQMNSPIKSVVQIAKAKEVWLRMEMIHQLQNGV